MSPSTMAFYGSATCVDIEGVDARSDRRGASLHGGERAGGKIVVLT